MSTHFARSRPNGGIGAVDLVMAHFGFAAWFDPVGRLWNSELGSGACWMPRSTDLVRVVDPRCAIADHHLRRPARTGVDARATISLTTASGANALLATSITSALPVRATIVGSDGRIDLHAPFFAPTGLTLVQGSFGDETTATWSDTRFTVPHDGLSDQATALASYVAEGRTESPVHPLNEVVSVLATIDESRRLVAG